MNNYCINLLKRSRQKKIVFYCKEYKRYIDYQLDCKNCLKRNFVRNKGIKKVSKKRIFVTKETYNKVYDRDKGKCRLKDFSCNGELELHHIRYRSEAKDLINEPTNCIMLCVKHHKEVHSNKKYWQPKLKEMIGEN